MFGILDVWQDSEWASGSGCWNQGKYVSFNVVTKYSIFFQKCKQERGATFMARRCFNNSLAASISARADIFNSCGSG